MLPDGNLPERIARGLFRAGSSLSTDLVRSLRGASGKRVLRVGLVAAVYWFGIQAMWHGSKAVAQSLRGLEGAFFALLISTSVMSSVGLLARLLLDSQPFSRAQLIQMWGSWACMGMFFGIALAGYAFSEESMNSNLHQLAELFIASLAIAWWRYGPAGAARRTA